MTGALQQDLIAAVATPPGQGGIGVIRLSGQDAHAIASKICTRPLTERTALFTQFHNTDGLIDEGLAIWFPHGSSFTGEEVVELQTHGSPVVLQQLLNCCVAYGARLARPGEFSERAFLNGKMDLAQAEAVADLIASSSVAAAQAAMRSLQGEFSTRVNDLAEQVAQLRIRVEAAIDFPDEDVEILEESQVGTGIETLSGNISLLLEQSRQGQLLSDGITVTLIGPPNAGKSSLLNTLAGSDAAIVTDIPGTTRDLLKVDLTLDGIPVTVVDTAGLRVSNDEVERIGVERAQAQARVADVVIVVVDANQFNKSADGALSAQGISAAALQEQVNGLAADVLGELTEAVGERYIIALNKSDLLSGGSGNEITRDSAQPDDANYVWVSALRGQGITRLKDLLLERVGFTHDAPFTARLRHIEALQRAASGLRSAAGALAAGQTAELIAEELRAAHNDLGEIVGTVTPDDLLGRIFSEFCIGK